MLYMKPEEFACKCNHPDCDAKPVSLELLAKSDTLRARWGKPLVVNSGCRCARHNQAVGGVPGSEHVEGKAGDFKTANRAESILLAKEAEAVGFGGIGIYETWVHCDVGPKRRWSK